MTTNPERAFNWQSGITDSEAATVLAAAIAENCSCNRPALLFHNLQAMAARIQYLQSCFPAQTLHALAIKANPMLALLRYAVQWGMGLEAASLEEVALARAAGCPPAHIVYDSPAKTRHELAQALAWGVTVNADNLQELQRIKLILDTQLNSDSLIGLRVNPQVGNGNIDMLSVSGQYSKFGEPLGEKRAAIIKAFKSYPWLRALHVHVGSQGIAQEQMVLAVARIFELRTEIHTQLGEERIQSVDIGGGLPWCYQADESITTPATYVAELKKRIPAASFDNVRLITEFGRALQAGCGFAASQVEYLKVDSGKRTAVIHFGADLFMRKVYQPTVWHHRISVHNADGSLKQGDQIPHTLVGPLCFGGDILADNVLLPAIEEGDWVVLYNTGAYTISLWSRHCNRGLPKVLGYAPDPIQFQVLLPGESPEDVVRFWDTVV
jgi:diaminopimelate decarboxylase